ncbi:cleavage and polyadenylation specificity factor subunit 3 [Nematocida parisii]|uniref:Endoribonuclease YSH1 n=1 Tax=Nematocida parisii (strain ERTm3) TaxID=935791 RepID=I3EKN7_NEMP3|nr:cleavage and polyadenylation specificity factor 3 [Nematocida parisii ERTm1]EIJ89784.1 cleavage and polyadenylation specificity factor 3 [Nematocida parisii ERTm3]KAI5144681.1 cleavage and polyadenylation specificity factor subunit 3 [Nematocida parisii]EIJ94013.1 cleavage and polyadenylation specificity factor 3 [Nematocida parisii ERTm1]KAI5154495.1 cleavage and polyadenylation specificity factor subunit 3 [Nematocida parisii]KAI5157499.1 cleavage and polyadenylation specificity factor su|eukprot:XP_013058509.1 cleavage and polyadenylation specificity factor 3 [Nematocida parisii ERTm1]
MDPTICQTAARILPLGAGSEVGRSCVVTKFRGVTVMFDCGVHPAYTGVSSLPFFDLIDPAEIDVILVTHFHLDHAGALPYFTERSGFKGKIYMTHPTRAIFRWLLNDYVRVSNVSSENDLFTEKELAQCYDKIIPIDYGQEIPLKNITIIAYNAGHVLGAAMFLVKNEDISLLYTGDYSREEDRHLKAAVIPPMPIDILISESTYGVQCHQSKEERETRFITGVSDVVKRGGKCLLPVFALGRAQELLLILDEFWDSRKDLQGIPILYASALAKRFMAVYQTYLNMMNDRIQGMAEISNPFHFKHVQSIKNIEAYEDRGPCVMMASPGMLQNGLSRDLFEMWCGDKRNGCIIPGYCVEGTLAKDLLCEPDEITSLKGNKLVVRSSIDYISFSAHVDFLQNAEFIEGCKVSEVVLVHGESSEMNRLKSALVHRSESKSENMVVHTPRNGEWVQIKGTGEINVKYLGTEVPDEFSGFMHIAEDGKVSVVERDSVSKLGISEIKIVEKAKMQGVSFQLLISQIDRIFDESPEIKESESIRSIEVDGVHIYEDVEGSITIQWESSFRTDVLANCIIKAINDTVLGKNSVQIPLNKKKSKKCGGKECTKEDNPTEEENSTRSFQMPKESMNTVAHILSNYFSLTKTEGGLEIQDKDKKVTLSPKGLIGDESLAKIVQEVFDSISWAVKNEVALLKEAEAVE